jgi:hypothetical protein
MRRPVTDPTTAQIPQILSSLTGYPLAEDGNSQVKVTLWPMISRPVLVSSPIRGRRRDFCCCQTTAVLSLLCTHSYERTGLSSVPVIQLKQPFCFVVFKTNFSMPSNLSSSELAPLCSVVICLNTVATTFYMSFKDKPLTLVALTDWFGWCWLYLKKRWPLISRAVVERACAIGGKMRLRLLYVALQRLSEGQS